MRLILASTALSVMNLLSLPAHAQDYPYDDPKQDPLPVESPEDTPETEKNGEKPSGKRKAARPPRRLPALFRVGLKVGGNFTYIQAPSADGTTTVTVSEPGYEALFALGWDLPYQPVFIEFESGYRALFAFGEDPYHTIALGGGVHYRSRIGTESLWKPGIKAYFDFRIQDTTDEVTGEASTDFGVFPSVGISSIFEFGNFLIEPLVFVNRVQASRTFLSFALRAGYRF